jgi:hypothetical protein
MEICTASVFVKFFCRCFYMYLLTVEKNIQNF